MVVVAMSDEILAQNLWPGSTCWVAVFLCKESFTRSQCAESIHQHTALVLLLFIPVQTIGKGKSYKEYRCAFFSYYAYYPVFVTDMFLKNTQILGGLKCLVNRLLKGVSEF